MAMRRRIKVGVNLTAAKRKSKTEANETVPVEVGEQIVPKTIKAEGAQSDATETQSKNEDVQPQEFEPKTEPPTDDSAFKFPLKVDFNRSNSNTTTNTSDEQNQSEIDDGVHVMQMDLQRSSNGIPSPSKTQQRQRIKPSPIFGQKRNSQVGPPPSPLPNDCDVAEQAATSQRRDRHYSGLQSNQPAHNTISKVPSHNTCRIRTESICSIFSDSHMSTTSKSRKVDDQNSHRSNTRRDFEARFSYGVPEKSSIKMFDLIYYNPATNPMEQKRKIDQTKTETKEEEQNTDAEMKNNDDSAVPVPQLKLNAKGELILDDKSLEIETTAEQEARKVLAKSSLIYLDENTGMNGFYTRKKRTREWPADETIRFYRCLKTIGTDFSMMCQLFPKRSRRDIKLKYKREERCNGALINKALLHPNSFDIQELKDQFETEDRQREEEERTKNSHKSIQYKKVNIKTSKSARALKNADDIYNHELNDLETKKNKKQRKDKKSNKEETQEHTTYEQLPSEEIEDVALLPVGEREYDHTNHFDYIDDYNEVQEENEFIDEHDNSNSRTFVNMDSGNVTLIKDNQPEYTDRDEQNERLIQNSEIIDNDITTSPIIISDEISTSPNIISDEISSTAAASDKESLYPNITTQCSSATENIAVTEEIETPTTKIPYSVNDETEIKKILEDIVNGTLVVVSTFNPSSPEELTNGIYMLDPSTGELCDEPLDIPQEIIQSILTAMT